MDKGAGTWIEPFYECVHVAQEGYLYIWCCEACVYMYVWCEDV